MPHCCNHNFVDSAVLQPISFAPLPLLSSGHIQTILGGFPSLRSAPPSVTHLVSLNDGDILACEVATPTGWHPEQRTAFLIHGLCGSDRSPRVIRLARKLYRRGVKVVRINLRGCGSGKGHARKPYHGGCSGDIAAVLKAFKTETPYSPFCVTGFSLGGNIALKLAGELGSAAEDLLDLVIAISPPIDLAASVQRIGLSENRLYEVAFIRGLLQEVTERHAMFPELQPVMFPFDPKLFAFDQLYTAPAWGFTDALDYYDRASAKPLIKNITIRSHIIVAEDDPIIDPYALDPKTIPNSVQVWRTACGGHMGYVARPRRGQSIHWLDQLMIKWIEAS
ncbi:Uncharacterized protein SCG7086_BQ_00070 [Chlamydiales bacterium SCGC AG-110-P3]|nr:Uncharacterized protein SCG7086_BQ_00070 [Chlamydiales bacterium SCGC AG-110-P3]